MDRNSFIKALLPIWIAEVVIVGLYHVFGAEEVTVLSIVLTVVSCVLLPLIAGLRVVHLGGGIGTAILGGVSISVVSILAVGVSFFIQSAGFLAIVGYIIATLMYVVLPQAVFGSIGGFLARKIYAKTT